jgi:hypothetical protein
MKLGQMGAPVDNVSEHTFYHEWGHALDYNLQSSENKRTAYSDTPAFITPYLNELFDAIKHHRRDFQEMHYFVSDSAGSSNRTEMFAEMYTIARGKGDPKNYPSDKMIPKDFKNTYAKTESELDKRF